MIMEEYDEKPAKLLDTPRKRKAYIRNVFYPENSPFDECKDGLNWQCNPTPYEIVSKLISKVDLANEKSILVMFNLEIIEELMYGIGIASERITFIADTIFEKMFASMVYKVNAYLVDDQSLKTLTGVIMGMNKKFDVVFSNPPYNASVDIKILQNVVDISNELVIVHPSTWIIDNKGIKTTFNKFKGKINGKLKSVELFNGNKVFDIGLFVPCMITHIDNNHSGECEVKLFNDPLFKVNDISDITKFGESWNIIKPLVEYMDTCDSVLNYKTENINSLNKYYVQLAAIRGNVSKDPNVLTTDDFYTMVMKDSEKNKEIRTKNPDLVWGFDSEIEQNNFIDYLKTDFVRFCLAIYKNSANVHRGEMELIPWMDFAQKWNDEKLYKHFNVSKDLQEYITKFLPDYYNLRK